MNRFLKTIGVLTASVLLATSAFAHAFLDHALPGVGATVSASPSELELTFTQNIVPAFSGVSLAATGGGAIPVGKPIFDPANPSTIHVHLSHALKPGIYIVSWHVVSVDTHPTSGTYQFTIAP